MLVTPREIVVFRAKDGGVPFEVWLDDLMDKRAVARVLARLARVRQGNLGDCKPVGEGGVGVARGLWARLPGLFRAEGPDLGGVALRRGQADAGARHPAGEAVLAGIQSK